MKFEVQFSGASGKSTRIVDLARDQDRWKIVLDGKPVEADVVQVSPHTLSVLLDGQSIEVHVTELSDGQLKMQTGLREFAAAVADPRAWRGRSHSAIQLEGRQQVVAPMPGKVVRLLVQAGDHVEAGQGLLVIEAMKMQNEIRSPKQGAVERLLVQAGQAVNAGEALCVVS
ncbi:MAG TPA: biotin/lipoyl-containing protein [Candidatus Acidoferrum sp.]|nr:biotin/lipoyl-containing protein [Candidatus Acidoferrum sp.]